VADLYLIDPDAYVFTLPNIVFDLPSGGRQLLQEAISYGAPVKRSLVTFDECRPTDELPGQYLRGA
jgi:N-acyl-D-aspartate/D-glutamate deacylase